MNNASGDQKSKCAIPFIQTDSKSKKQTVGKTALEMISSVEQEVIFISVAGRQRSGKSLLLNKLLWKFGAAQFESSLFSVGDTINPCTEGIWIQSRPILHSNRCFFLIDSEGKDSLIKDKKHDAKLMSVISVLSSFLLLNVKGVMDLEEFQVLDTIAYFSAKLAQSGDDRGGTGPALAPELLIVLRDFELLLEDPVTHCKLDETQQLEEILKRAPDSGSDSAKLDPMKARIKKQFTCRTLHTLPFPADVDERNMHRLKSLPYADFYPDFIAQFDKMFQHMVKNAAVKSYNGMRFSGKILATVVAHLVESINNDSMLELDFAWKQMLRHEFNTICKKQSASVKSQIQAFKQQASPHQSTGAAYSVVLAMRETLLKAAHESTSLNNAEMTVQICKEVASTLAMEGESFLEENQMNAKQYNEALSGKTTQRLNQITQHTLVDKFDLEAYKIQVNAHLADQLTKLVDNQIQLNNYQCVRLHFENSFKSALKFTQDHYFKQIDQIQIETESQLSERDNHIYKLKTTNEMSDKEMKNQIELKLDYQNRNKESVSQIDKLEITLSDRIKEVTNLKGKIADQDAIIKDQKSEFQAFKKEISDKTIEIMNADNQQSNEKSKNNRAEERLNHQNNEIDKLTKQIAKIEQEQNNEISKNKNNEEKQRLVIEELKTKTKNNDEKQTREIKDLNIDINKINIEYKNKEIQKENIIKNLEKQKINLNSKIEKMTEEKAAEAKSAAAALDDLSCRNQDLTAKLGVLTEEKAAEAKIASDTIEDLLFKLDDLTAKLGVLTEEKAAESKSAIKSIYSLNDEISFLSNQNVALFSKQTRFIFKYEECQYKLFCFGESHSHLQDDYNKLDQTLLNYKLESNNEYEYNLNEVFEYRDQLKKAHNRIENMIKSNQELYEFKYKSCSLEKCIEDFKAKLEQKEIQLEKMQLEFEEQRLKENERNRDAIRSHIQKVKTNSSLFCGQAKVDDDF